MVVIGLDLHYDHYIMYYDQGCVILPYRLQPDRTGCPLTRPRSRPRRVVRHPILHGQLCGLGDARRPGFGFADRLDPLDMLLSLEIQCRHRFSSYGIHKPRSLAAVSCCSFRVMNAKSARRLVRDNRSAKYTALARCHIRMGDKLANACILSISAPRLPLGWIHSIPDKTSRGRRSVLQSRIQRATLPQ